MSDKFPGGFLTAGAPAGFSVAFDGTGDFLTVPASSNFAPGTGDFTVDGWIYPTSSAIQRFFAQTTGGTNYFCCEADVPNKTIRFIGTSSGGGTPILSAATLQINQWNYFCISRTSGTVTVWCNGSAGTPTSNTTDFNNTSYVPTISGYTHSTSSEPIIGYLAGLRYIKGTALSGAVAPTVAFPVTNTQLLTCQSPTIIDLSTNALTVTVNGDAKVSNFTPFAGYTGFNPALGAAAGGVWTLDEAAYYQQNRIWPIYDPYFNQTTLMLHGNGTNGAQNNTFLDSSTNNFTITRNGNTTQGSFSPFSQTGWSNYQGAVDSSYLNFTTSPGTLFQFAGDFTIESWIYPTALASDTSIWVTNDGGSSYFAFNVDSTNYTIWLNSTGSSAAISHGLTLNQWNHVAWVRSGSTNTLYTNGVARGTYSNGSTVGYANPTVNRNGGGSSGSSRYMSNLRIVKSAVYTSAFTPPTTPLTNIANTSLLTCQSNRFVDNSSNALVATVTGTPSVQAFSPFVPAYITPTTYSNWFDGTGDYLSSSSANYTATGDFTAEAWFYATSNPAFGGIINTRPQSNTTGWAINLDSSQKIRFYINGTDFPAGYTSYNLNQWYHVALVRSGSTVTGYVNGISVGTTTNSSTTTTTDLVIGRFYSDLDNYYLNGVVSNARFVNGTALYTTNFTPPSAPFPTGTTNQQLLTCQASTLIDSNTYTTAKTITANGNVRPVTSPTPFPAKVDTTTLNSAYSTSLIGGSAYFDGNDYLSLSSTSLNLGANDFTIETWVYATTTARDFVIGSIRNADGVGSWMIMFNDSQPIRFFCRYNGGTVLDYQVGSGTFPTNQWVHLAITRSGANLRVFQNGTQVGTTNTTLSTFSIDNAITNYYIASSSDPSDFYTGYLSGTRVVVGTALYTQNFAPPIAPPTAVANTSLLLNSTNGAIFDNTAKNVLETVGTAAISTTQSKWGGSSMKFDGSTSSWLLVPFRPTLDLSTGAPDWTLECWGYVADFTNSPFFFNKGGVAATYYTNYAFSMTGNTSTGTVYCTLGNNGGETAYTFGTCSVNTWYHFAATRQGSTIRTFLNGVLVTSQTIAATMTDNGEALYVGCLKNLTSNVLNGYVDDLRITKGYARYTTNFTPPTSQLQDQ